MFGNGCPVLERRLAKRVRGLQSCAVDYQGSSIPDITPAEMSMSKRQWEKSLQKRRHQLKDGLDNRAPTPPPPATPPLTPAPHQEIAPDGGLVRDTDCKRSQFGFNQYWCLDRWGNWSYWWRPALFDEMSCTWMQKPVGGPGTDCKRSQPGFNQYWCLDRWGNWSYWWRPAEFDEMSCTWMQNPVDGPGPGPTFDDQSFDATLPIEFTLPRYGWSPAEVDEVSVVHTASGDTPTWSRTSITPLEWLGGPELID
jgi:hypothetical protein